MVKVSEKLIEETKAMIRLYFFLWYDCGLREVDKLSAKDLKSLPSALNK